MDNNGGFQNGFQTDQFILAGTGETETWTPKFSYKGFQYIEVTGWPGDDAPPLSAFTAKVLHTDAERTGQFGELQLDDEQDPRSRRQHPVQQHPPHPDRHPDVREERLDR
ncbi:family 78 glycoside hydrolase catalytic domain [Aeromicrobium sp. UC242_57]|uniref:family 78 glycoside hydrolase catalytic domain n=1 Tax=Aeromicrobium sp. UC242_57 TaxID=3374624 RepID=UPI00378EA91B